MARSLSLSPMRGWVASGVLALVVVATGVVVAEADRTYTVRSGDTLSHIARRFRVSIDEIKLRNRMRNDRVRPGQRLRIPSRGDRRGAYRAGYHVVRRGESLSRIANRYRVPIRSLRRLNRIRGDRIRVGQRLRIPGRRSENPMPRVQTRPLRSDQEAAAPRAETLGLGPVRVGQNLLKGAPDARWVEAAREAPTSVPSFAYGVGTPIDPREVPAPPVPAGNGEGIDETGDDLEEDDATEGDETPEPSAGDGTLMLPIETAYYMRGWGSGPGGYHLAVDVGSPPGTPIRASERGIVAYVGHGIRGYGRFVMIVHPNGLVTAYAHNRETLVVPGELVARGQVVSLLGNTGLSRGPHLHYMLLHEGQHCDPLPLLRPMIRFRNGRRVATQIARYEGERPDEVRCLPRDARRHPGVRRRRSRSRMSSRMRARMR